MVKENTIAVQTRKNIYFIADAHLGSLAVPHPRMQERRLVRFLDSIKTNARAVYMLGDMFDFWHEWGGVVPKGYTRFLGKISELTDMGIEVHYFTGNHDIWSYGYLEKECGVIMHREPATVEIYNKVFYLAHGDGLGDPDRNFRFIRQVFHSKVCQWLFATFIHPTLAMRFGLAWAKHSRLTHDIEGDSRYLGEDREHLILYTKEYLATHPDIDFFLYGHRHIELDLLLSHSSRMMILGDWISQFSYAVFDGEHMLLSEYEEGETEF